jgi:hypothetical protein
MGIFSRFRERIPQDLVYLDVCLPDLRSQTVPADDALPSIDPFHHIEHVLSVDVVEEPDIGLVPNYYPFTTRLLPVYYPFIISIEIIDF